MGANPYTAIFSGRPIEDEPEKKGEAPAGGAAGASVAEQREMSGEIIAVAQICGNSDGDEYEAPPAAGPEDFEDCMEAAAAAIDKAIGGSRSVITVVRDPDRPLGKRFNISKDGKVKKQAAVTITKGVARMYYVHDHAALTALLTRVSEDPHAAIIPDRYRGVEVGEEFLMLSQEALAEKLGVQASDRTKLTGMHKLNVGGQVRKVVARLKENVVPGAWRLLDRDVDEHTPGAFAQASYEEWLAAVDRLLPGVAAADRVHAGSASARVYRDGKPVGGGNGHTWVKVSNPDDCERARTAIRVRSDAQGLSWSKPRFDRSTGERLNGPGMHATIIDYSVLTPGRLVFVGKPVAGPGLAVRPQQITQVSRSAGVRVLDTTLATMASVDVVRAATKAAGCELVIRSDGRSFKLDVYDLSLDTVLEAQRGSITVREAISRRERLRCQTPFRASDSFAAVLNFAGSGEPFLHDVGTGENHWLDDASRRELGLSVGADLNLTHPAD